MTEITTQAALDKALAKAPDGEFTLSKGFFRVRISGSVAPILIVLAGAHLDVAGTPAARPQVTAWENSQVTAWENSQVTAWENSQVTAWGNSQVTAWGNSQVTAWENSQVTARGNSQVTAWENSQVTARGYAFVRVFSARRVEASAHCIVACHSTDVTIDASTIVECPMPKTPPAWCDFYGVEVKDGVATLYKAVSETGCSPYGYDYSPGLIPVAHDWDGGKAECGGGLHFLPHPMMALAFNDQAKRFMACPVALTDIAVHPNGGSPEKVKARGLCAPTYEVDRNGKPLPVPAPEKAA